MRRKGRGLKGENWEGGGRWGGKRGESGRGASGREGCGGGAANAIASLRTCMVSDACRMLLHVWIVTGVKNGCVERWGHQGVNIIL